MDLAQSRTRRWVALTALACLVIVVAAWFVLVQPRRSDAAELRAQRVLAKENNDVLRTRLEELRVQFAKLPETRAKLAEINDQLPPSADLPMLVRTVDSLASTTGVTLISITPSAATAVNGSGGQAAGPAQPAPVAPAGPATAAPAAGSEMVTIPVSVVVSGDYFQAVSFLRSLQTGIPRAFLITALQITQGDVASGGNGVQVTVSGKIFSRPQGAADTSRTSGSPAGASSATPAASSPASPASPAPPASSPAASNAPATSPTASPSSQSLAVSAAGSAASAGSRRW